MILMSIFSLMFNTTTYLVIGAVLLTVFIAWLYAKHPPARQAIKTIAVVVVFGGALISAIYCANQLNIYYTASGGVFGYLVGSISGGSNTVETSDYLEYTVSNVEFRQVSDDWYSLTINADALTLESGENYVLLVNDVPCASEYTYNSKSLFAEYTYNFYNSTQDLLLQDTLNISIAFYENSTQIVISTYGGADAVSLWNQYFNKNNFVLKIQKTIYSKDSSLSFEDGDGETEITYCTVTYMDGEVEVVVQLYNPGTTLNDVPTLLTYDSYYGDEHFSGWELNGQASLDWTGLVVNEDLTFNATYSTSGVYDATTTQLVYSWEDLISSEIVSVADGEVYCNSALSGILIIDETITKIAEKAFYQFTGLTQVDIPATVTEIGVSAFNGCSKLVSCNFDTDSNLTTIESYAFCYTKLSSIEVPASVTMINTYAFYGCSSLMNIDLDCEITTIFQYTFAHCTALSSISIPNTVTDIRSYAFLECSALTSLEVPLSVTYIYANAFNECSGLQYIYIPASVETIFAKKANSTGVVGREPTYVDSPTYSPFYGCSSDLTIYCEASSQPEGWTTYWNYYDDENALTVVWGIDYETYCLNLSGEYLVTFMVWDEDAEEYFVYTVMTESQAKEFEYSRTLKIEDGSALYVWEESDSSFEIIYFTDVYDYEVWWVDCDGYEYFLEDLNLTDDIVLYEKWGSSTYIFSYYPNNLYIVIESAGAISVDYSYIWGGVSAIGVSTTYLGYLEGSIVCFDDSESTYKISSVLVYTDASSYTYSSTEVSWSSDATYVTIYISTEEI